MPIMVHFNYDENSEAYILPACSSSKHPSKSDTPL